MNTSQARAQGRTFALSLSKGSSRLLRVVEIDSVARIRLSKAKSKQELNRNDRVVKQ